MNNRLNTKRLYEAACKEGNEKRFFDDFSQALEEGQIEARDFSVTSLFEDFVEEGREIVSQWRNNPESRMSLLEAGVSSSAFTNIQGQLLVNEVMAGYDDPTFIGSDLCDTVNTRLPKGEKIPGLSEIGNEAEGIGEGKEYPLVGFQEDWIETPETIKRGMICPLTREMIVQDLTGQVMERARSVGQWIGYNKEIRVLQTALGITSSYKRKNRAVVATYGDNSGDHDFDNLAASNTLVDWTDIETAELLFDAMTDPNTGTPIMVRPNRIVVPTALKHTARRTVHATELRSGDITTGSGNQTISGNVLDDYQISTSNLVKTVTSSDSDWFLGDFKKAFRYMQVSPITVVAAPNNSHDEFHRDIMAQWKVSEWGAAAVFDPRYVVKST